MGKIELLVIDCDGILNDNTFDLSVVVDGVSSDENGLIIPDTYPHMSKRFNHADGFAILRIQEMGIKVAMLTRLSKVSDDDRLIKEALCKAWNIPCEFVTYPAPKIQGLLHLIEQHLPSVGQFSNMDYEKYAKEHVAYAGDTQDDVECLKACAFGFCPPNSQADIMIDQSEEYPDSIYTMPHRSDSYTIMVGIQRFLSDLK